MKVLTVHEPFGHQASAPEGKEAPAPRHYAKGEMIRDPAEIERVVKGGHAHHCTAAEVDEGFFADAPPAAESPRKPRGAA